MRLVLMFVRVRRIAGMSESHVSNEVGLRKHVRNGVDVHGLGLRIRSRVVRNTTTRRELTTVSNVLRDSSLLTSGLISFYGLELRYLRRVLVGEAFYRV